MTDYKPHSSKISSFFSFRSLSQSFKSHSPLTIDILSTTIFGFVSFPIHSPKMRSPPPPVISLKHLCNTKEPPEKIPPFILHSKTVPRTSSCTFPSQTTRYNKSLDKTEINQKNTKQISYTTANQQPFTTPTNTFKISLIHFSLLEYTYYTTIHQDKTDMNKTRKKNLYRSPTTINKKTQNFQKFHPSAFHFQTASNRPSSINRKLR